MKIILIALAVLLVGFVGWMNVTLGHFQPTDCCGCKVSYRFQVTKNGCYLNLCTDCRPTFLDYVLFYLAKLDFNK